MSQYAFLAYFTPPKRVTSSSVLVLNATGVDTDGAAAASNVAPHTTP